MSLNCCIFKTIAPEFGIYFYMSADRVFVIQIGLYDRFLEINLGEKKEIKK